MKSFLRLGVVLLFLSSATPTWAQRDVFTEPEEKGVRLGEQAVQRIRIGLTVRAVGGSCTGLYATLPVPMAWPEQEVEIIEEEISTNVRNVTYRDTNNSARQMLVSIPNLAAGQTARVLITFEVRRRILLPPVQTEQYQIPDNVPRDMAIYLGTSPYIETRHADIRNTSRAIGGEDLPAWQQAEFIYDWVRNHVEYVNGPLKGAVAALRDETGDCEELTSLFIALCRHRNIPARMVWVPGHCYPEFYLVDADGEGHWFPCQAAGTRDFGGLVDPNIILQKGDNFRVPEHREPQRYITEFLRGDTRGGGGQPQVQFYQVPVAVN